MHNNHYLKQSEQILLKIHNNPEVLMTVITEINQHQKEWYLYNKNEKVNILFAKSNVNRNVAPINLNTLINNLTKQNIQVINQNNHQIKTSDYPYLRQKIIADNDLYQICYGKIIDPQLIKRTNNDFAYYQKAKKNFIMSIVSKPFFPKGSSSNSLTFTEYNQQCRIRKNEVSGPIIIKHWSENLPVAKFLQNNLVAEKAPFWIDCNSILESDNFALTNTYLKNSHLKSTSNLLISQSFINDTDGYVNDATIIGSILFRSYLNQKATCFNSVITDTTNNNSKMKNVCTNNLKITNSKITSSYLKCINQQAEIQLNNVNISSKVIETNADKIMNGQKTD